MAFFIQRGLSNSKPFVTSTGLATPMTVALPSVFAFSWATAWSHGVLKKQPMVSRSSTEAEYRSMAITATELFWIRMLFKELRISLPFVLVLWCDNVSALALVSNPVFHARTKHIEVDYHFIREKVFNGDILVKFISTLDQVADTFTKGLSSSRFVALKFKLMIFPSPISLRGDVKQSAIDHTDDSTEDHDQSTSFPNEVTTNQAGPSFPNLTTANHEDHARTTEA
jgi:hypothetical protein